MIKGMTIGTDLGDGEGIMIVWLSSWAGSFFLFSGFLGFAGWLTGDGEEVDESGIQKVKNKTERTAATKEPTC